MGLGANRRDFSQILVKIATFTKRMGLVFKEFLIEVHFVYLFWQIFNTKQMGLQLYKCKVSILATNSL